MKVTFHVQLAFAEVLALEVPDDGARFDTGSLAIDLIPEDQKHGDVRAQFLARIASPQERLQVDVGFGDAITSEAAFVEFPPPLDFPAPRLQAHPRETVVAEKLQAMVQLGSADSHMKDFYGIAARARDFGFEGALLTCAIRTTCERRATPMPGTLPVPLTDAFASDTTEVTQ